MSQPEPIINTQLKTALVYDRINTPYGGAEQVLLALQQLFPKAPVFTSVYDPHSAAWAQNMDIHPSCLQKIPFAKQHHRAFLPLMPLAFEKLNLYDYELIISITSAEAKGVLTQPHQTHICYLLSPPRYLYSHRQQYLKSKPILGVPGINWFSNKILDYLRWWDQAAIHRPDAVIPLSKLVQQRVSLYYKNVKTLNPIYPPIDVINNFKLDDNGATATSPEYLKSLNLPAGFNLVVSRLVSYKRIDLAIKACLELEQPLVIVGAGPQLKQLKHLSTNFKTKSKKTEVVFLGNQPQAVVDLLLEKANLVLAPGEDDFGLTPLQANLKGTPAVIYEKSGVAEVIADGVGGVHITQLSKSGVIRAVNRAGQTNFSSDIIKQLAKNHTTDKFLLKFKSVVQAIVSQNQHKKSCT